MGNRPREEITDALQLVKDAYGELIIKHETYTELIEDDETFEQEELWLEDCQNAYLELETNALDYIKMSMENEKTEVEDEIANPLTDNNGNQGETGTPPPDNNGDQNSHEETGERGNETEENGIETLETNSTSASAIASTANHNVNMSGVERNNQTSNEAQNSGHAPCGFKMEKPKMPLFNGDVRDNAIFRADFKHAVDTRYGKRDAISLLRTSLQGRPLELIKGIGTDYDAAWEYLDSIYGDPRFVAGTVTQDIVRFRPLCEGEDARFCDLVHLIQRSFNTLKEVGRPYDMDNNHMLALIEQRMCTDDRKVWARHLESDGKEATLAQLITWMNAEMKSRVRATAPLISSAKDNRTGEKSEMPCWVQERRSA